MTERVCYRLVARSPFHFGERGVGPEESSLVLRSDTLFAALCLTLRELGQDLDALLARFPRVKVEQDAPPNSLPGETPPPFRLSSAFPFAGDVYLFPRPMLRPPGTQELDDPRLGKTLKKIQFVSQPIFEKMLAGQLVSDYLVEREPDENGVRRPRQGVLLQGGQVWVTPRESESLQVFEDWRTAEIRLWDEYTAARVTVDRATNRSQVYATGQVRFAQDCGLFFLIEYGDPAWRPRIEAALRALGDSGVGGRRSSGHGQFRLKAAGAFALAEPPPDQADAFATLALYWPLEQEVRDGVLDGASYGLVNRRGWIGSLDGMNLRRRGVRMLSEGSVLLRRPVGALADVKPLDPTPVANVPHGVWRYGMAFPLRCRTLEKEPAYER